MRFGRVLVVSIAMLLGAASPAQAAFAGINGRIAFDRTLTSGLDQIFSVAPDGSGPVNLSNDPAANDVNPVYSRDGKLIAFARDTSGTGSAIWVMNADGSGQHQVSGPGSPGPGPGNGDLQPAFSPNGRQIVFERTVGASSELLFVVGVDGTGQHQLLTPPTGFQGETPTWSPDGTKIAFMREPTDDSGGRITVVNADGTGTATAVSNPPAGFKDGDPSFSPDGTKLVFGRASTSETNPPPAPSNVFVVNLNGTGETNLTQETTSTTESEAPAFSPDGKLIAYGRCQSCYSGPFFAQLYVMAADGSGKHAITPAVAGQFDRHPNWQPLARSTPVPVLSGLGVSPSKASIAGRRVKGKCFKQTKKNKSHKKCRRSVKLTVSYSINVASSVTFTLTRSLPGRTGRKVKGKCVKQTKKNKKHKRCTRVATVPGITGPGAAGANSFTLDAKKLGPGSYVLTATPRAAGRAGAARRASFKVVS